MAEKEQVQEPRLGDAEVALLNKCGDLLSRCNGNESIAVDWLPGARAWQVRALGPMKGKDRWPALRGREAGLGDALAFLFDLRRERPGDYPAMRPPSAVAVAETLSEMEEAPDEAPDDSMARMVSGGVVAKESGSAFVAAVADALPLTEQAVIVGPDGSRVPLLPLLREPMDGWMPYDPEMGGFEGLVRVFNSSDGILDEGGRMLVQQAPGAEGMVFCRRVLPDGNYDDGPGWYSIEHVSVRPEISE